LPLGGLDTVLVVALGEKTDDTFEAPLFTLELTLSVHDFWLGPVFDMEEQPRQPMLRLADKANEESSFLSTVRPRIVLG
jgi:hypothetical protein